MISVSLSRETLNHLSRGIFVHLWLAHPPRPPSMLDEIEIHQNKPRTTTPAGLIHHEAMSFFPSTQLAQRTKKRVASRVEHLT